MKLNQRIAIAVTIIVSIFVNITCSAPTATTPANKTTAETKLENKNNVQTTSTKPEVKTLNNVTVQPKDSNNENKVKSQTTVAKVSSKITIQSTTSVDVKPTTATTVQTSLDVKPTTATTVQTSVDVKPTTATTVQTTEKVNDTANESQNVSQNTKDKSGVETVKTDQKDNLSKQTSETTSEKPDKKIETSSTENKSMDKNVAQTEKVDQKATSDVKTESNKKVVENEKGQDTGDENQNINLASKTDKKSNNDEKSVTTTGLEKTLETTTKSSIEQQIGKNVAKTENLESKSEIKPVNVNKERRNNVRRNVITTSTTTQSTVTELETATTWDGLPCSSRFRAHPVDKSKFETAFSENVFEKIYQSCPSPLEWRQDQCRCGWPEPEVIENCKCCSEGLKAHPKNNSMYLRLVNGQWLEETCSTYDNNQLWDDEGCSCVWNPNKPQSHKAPVFRGAILPRLMTKCMNLVNMTLDEGLKDGNGRDLTPLFGRQRIRVVDEKGNIGKSVEIRRAPFKLGIFNGNDLQSTVHVKFNFKVHKDKVRMRKKMVIMSNGCKRRWQRKTIQPSLEVSFFPYNETFEVRFSTTGKTVVEYMTGTKDANGWYQCVLYLQDRVLNLKVNGQKVYSTNGMSGGVKTTDCPLTVAGSPTNAKNHFDGYLDELQVVKQCKYEPDTGS